MAQFPKTWPESPKSSSGPIVVSPMERISQGTWEGFEETHSIPCGEPSHRGPWLTVVEAARYAGWPCPADRAPASFYEIAQRIGVKINGKWRIHVDDLDGEIRRHAVPTR